jgi:hypothetical protein
VSSDKEFLTCFHLRVVSLECLTLKIKALQTSEISVTTNPSTESKIDKNWNFNNTSQKTENIAT